VVSGGAGIAGNVYVGTNLQVAGNIFLDNGSLSNIYAPSNGNLNISASNLNLLSTSKSIITGNTTLAGNLSVTSTLASSSTTTGALVVSGGVGVSGNVYAGGVVSPAAWLPGQVIKMTVLSNTDIGLTTYTNNQPTSGYTTIGSYTYTPASSASYLFITFQSRFTVSGTTDDSWYSQVTVDGTQVGYIFTQFSNNGGASLRTQPLFPLQGRYTNSSTASKAIAISARRDISDDNLTVNGDTSTWLTITEIAR
jgi:hypothetical protein